VRLDERTRPGQKLWETIHGLPTNQPQDMMFAVGWVDYNANFLYILAAAQNARLTACPSPPVPPATSVTLLENLALKLPPHRVDSALSPPLRRQDVRFAQRDALIHLLVKNVRGRLRRRRPRPRIPYGTKTILPKAPGSRISLWARGASASGSSFPMIGRSVPFSRPAMSPA
jgi:hypothetical protein